MFTEDLPEYEDDEIFATNPRDAVNELKKFNSSSKPTRGVSDVIDAYNEEAFIDDDVELRMLMYKREKLLNSEHYEKECERVRNAPENINRDINIVFGPDGVGRAVEKKTREELINATVQQKYDRETETNDKTTRNKNTQNKYSSYRDFKNVVDVEGDATHAAKLDNLRKSLKKSIISQNAREDTQIEELSIQESNAFANVEVTEPDEYKLEIIQPNLLPEGEKDVLDRQKKYPYAQTAEGVDKYCKIRENIEQHYSVIAPDLYEYIKYLEGLAGL